MKTIFRTPSRGVSTMILALPLLIISLTGCLLPKSDPTKYYVLTSLPDTKTSSQSGIMLGVARVNLAEYLNRRSLATRRGGEVRYSSFEEWAEPLDHGITRVLGNNVAAMAAGITVTLETWSVRAVTHELHMSIEEFTVDEKGKGLLASRWNLTAPGGNPIFQSGTSRVEKASTAQSIRTPERVRLMSDMLADASRELAAKVGQLPGAAR